MSVNGRGCARAERLGMLQVRPAPADAERNRRLQVRERRHDRVVEEAAVADGHHDRTVAKRQFDAERVAQTLAQSARPAEKGVRLVPQDVLADFAGW